MGSVNPAPGSDLQIRCSQILGNAFSMSKKTEYNLTSRAKVVRIFRVELGDCH